AGAGLSFGPAVDVDQDRGRAGGLPRWGGVDEGRDLALIETGILHAPGLDEGARVESPGLARCPSVDIPHEVTVRDPCIAVGRMPGAAEREPDPPRSRTAVQAGDDSLGGQARHHAGYRRRRSPDPGWNRSGVFGKAEFLALGSQPELTDTACIRDPRDTPSVVAQVEFFDVPGDLAAQDDLLPAFQIPPPHPS